MELLRNTVFGHFICLITRGKRFQFLEERDTSIHSRYVHKEKSARMARHGHTGEEDDLDGTKKRDSSTPSTPSTSSRSKSPDGQTNSASGTEIDPEKGKDVQVVDWFGPDDTEV
jgi:DHA1 family multidrug resistance protein-like MFS transporter